MKKKKVKVNRRISVVFLLMVIGGSFLPFFLSNFTDSGKNGEDTKIDENLGISGVSNWWNASYRCRVEVSIQEPGYYNRTNEPVDVYLSFSNQVCYLDTIRVMLYISSSNWEEKPYQIWNITMYDATYIKLCTLTFPATVEKDDTELYYVYYSDNNENGNIINPHQKYIKDSGFSSQLQDSKLSISTTEYDLELEEGKGFFNYTKGGLNYHTTNSLSPWIKNGQVDNIIYHPDPAEGGAIHNWLVLGTFKYYNPDWDTVVTSYSNHFDISKQYITGDYATGGDAPGAFLDESKQWTYFNFSTLDGYSSINGYMDFKNYFGSQNRVAYASCYIRSPVDLDSVYLKVGSDDGIKVIMDGAVIHYNHVLRRPQPDREFIGPLTFEAGKWYYFIVLIENRKGGTGFHFRFSNNTNLYGNKPQDDPGMITNLDISMSPPFPVIRSISEVENGPIFSKYDLSWEDSDDMKIFDTITIYNDYNLWKTERTLWWANERVNLSFSVFDSLYNNTNDVFDDYFYDNTWTTTGMANPSFTPENYTVLWDTGASKNLMALGIYLTDIEKGNPFIELSTLLWGINYDGSQKITNLRPGEVTDLDNKRTHSWPADSDYNIKITYWEFLDDNIGIQNNYAEANATLNGIYKTLKNPLVKVNVIEESNFFDLTVKTLDRDGLFVEGVQVFVYNSTLAEVSNQLTNGEGESIFLRLPKDNYTLNLTYSDNTGNFSIKENVQVTLNQTKTVVINNLPLTSLELSLNEISSPFDPIEGADVEFWYKNSTGELEYLIKSIESNGTGGVNLLWKNVSQSVANISVKVFLLGDYRDINNSFSGLGNNILNYSFEIRTIDTISVQISPYTTDISRIEPSIVPINVKFKGDFIDFKIQYLYTQNLTSYNISDATVSYSIQNTVTGLIVKSGNFNDDISPIGYYNYSLDTSDINLITGISYLIRITADKPGHTSKTVTVLFILKEIWTNFTSIHESIQVAYGENIETRVYFNDTLNVLGLGGAIVRYFIPGKTSGLLIEDISNLGWYNLTLNSTILGFSGTYLMSITAYKQNYVFQEVFINLLIQSISSDLILNVSNIEVVWNEILSLELRFNDTVNNQLLTDAVISYTTLGTIVPVVGTVTNLGTGVYTLTLNSSSIQFAGSYFLKISAVRSNYQTQTIDLPLTIYPILTTINGTFGLFQSIDVVVETPQILLFNYQIASSGAGLTNCGIKTCVWDRKDNDGFTIETGIMTLDNNYQGIYELDFETEDREIGTYTLVISLGKINYAERTAIIILNIIPRLFSFELYDPKLSGGIISVVSGKNLVISIDLIDYYDDSALIGVEVYLTLQSQIYNFTDNGDGTYSVAVTNLPTAFLTSLQLRGEITAKMANYTDEIKLIFVVINMAEIFPGFPMFYFLMIVGAISGIVVSLVAYRVVLQRRIPTLVKKVRAMKKSIKKKKSISESLLYPTKEEYIAKKFGDNWDMLGLSRQEMFGSEYTRKKKLPKLKYEFKNPNGGED